MYVIRVGTKNSRNDNSKIKVTSFINIINILYNLLLFKSVMDLTENKRPKRVIEVIEPNTTRVLELRKIREQQQRKKQQMDEEQRLKREEDERLKKNLEKMKEKQKYLLEQRRLQQIQRKRLEEDISNTLSGKFGHIINDLNTHSSNLEFTISGLDLRPAQIKVLVNNVENNASLKALSMSRKGLTDVEGKEVCEKLEKNQTLQRLELEGNKLGPITLQALSKLLKVNQTIRYIDLENNNLLVDDKGKKNYDVIKKFVESLIQNETVLYINLNNTGLDAVCSKMMCEIFKNNSTLILLDIQNNEGMNLDDVLFIQERLVQNKRIHDDQRYKQYIQRKRMRRQQDISGVLLLNQQTKKLRQEAIQLNTKTKKKQLDNEWDEFIKRQQALKLKMIAKLQKQSKTKTKKKKKKPAKK